MLFLDDLFAMGGGYVLNFSDRTFALFFAEELNIDIDNPMYAQGGTSKGKRLRYFLRSVDTPTAVRTLKALWEYREAAREHAGQEETVNNAQGRFLRLLDQLQGTTSRTHVQVNAIPAHDRDKIRQLGADLICLSKLDPQPRGFTFEKFLKELFDAFGLEAREPFRLTGEQIDGSFILSGETYLLEAKWQNAPSSISDLHTFHGKIEQKAAWSRGLFVSYSGFSPEALVAFGRGKRVVCMDGYDLSEVLNRELPLARVLDAKVRRAAETGAPFIRVRELFPG